jgi:hypothetical protein
MMAARQDYGLVQLSLETFSGDVALDGVGRSEESEILEQRSSQRSRM